MDQEGYFFVLMVTCTKLFTTLSVHQQTSSNSRLNKTYVYIVVTICGAPSILTHLSSLTHSLTHSQIDVGAMFDITDVEPTTGPSSDGRQGHTVCTSRRIIP